MIERTRRPLIDRPRYISKPPKVVNTKTKNKTLKPVNKRNPNKQQTERKVTDKQVQMMQQKMQQPVSGSMDKIDEDIKVKPPVKSKPPQKKKTKKPPAQTRKPKVTKDKSREDKTDNGLFKQMKDKFIGNSKDEGDNQDN